MITFLLIDIKFVNLLLETWFDSLGVSLDDEENLFLLLSSVLWGLWSLRDSLEDLICASESWIEQRSGDEG